MSSTADAFLRSWPFEPWLLVSLLVVAAIYVRGWLLLRRRHPRRWHAGRLSAFLGGLAAIYLALASPIEPFSALLLQVHMLQHLLLMMAAPPLLWLGAPLFPLLRGLPRVIRLYWCVPFLSSPALRRLFGWLTRPLPALVVFLSVTWLWHIPAIYEVALRSSGWHYLQHICFLVAALLFWYPVVLPYPGRLSWSLWLLLPYLLAADLSNTALSALLTLSDRVLYPYYTEVPRLAGISALEDQSTAGVIMWVPGSLVFLLPLFGIGIKLLSGSSADEFARPLNTPVRRAGSVSLPVIACSPHSVTATSFDLLRLPLLGRFLKWRHARLSLQIPMLVVAVAIIFDGFRGPQVGAMNLAGVLPWIHWRGLTIIGLLAAGNVFCMGCPFLLPRTIARRWLPACWVWPRQLRSKWLAVILIVVFLWAYEALSLWDRPRWTAWLAISYFVAAFAIDGLFRGASFCKYLCPIGQFNFVQSLVSPLEVKARDAEVCRSCRTKDCWHGRDGIPGCELHLFLPRKVGNMDCTVCLDCVHACPHDNVGLSARIPGKELWDDRQRSGVGRFTKRRDLAALVVVLVFGAFVNAAGMVAPVVDAQQRVAALAGSPLLTTTAFGLVGLVILPVVLMAGAAALSRHGSGLKTGVLDMATRYAYALVPIGFGMWLAHYSFHFLTSYDTAIPVSQRFVADIGVMSFGEPKWIAACCRPTAAWLLPLEILFLDGGLLLSLYAAYRIALAQSPSMATALKSLAPWMLLIVSLFAAGIWIVFQPMQMRGVLS